MKLMTRPICWLIALLAVLAWGQPFPNKPDSMPALLQNGFGPFGETIPSDGFAYCGPTAWTNNLFWLYSNGYRRLAPVPFEPAPSLPYLPGNSDPNAINMVRIVAGFFGTSPTNGTFGNPSIAGLQQFLSLKGIGPTHYKIETVGFDFNGETFGAEWFGEKTSGYGVADVNVYGFYVTGTNYAYNFGHNISFMASPNASTLVLANPWPYGGPSNPQFQTAVPVNDGSIYNGYLRLPNYYNDPTGQPTVLVLNGIALRMLTPPENLPAEPERWTPAEDVLINTNSGTFQAIAPLDGSVTLRKINTGRMILGGPLDGFSGTIALQDGTLTATAPVTRPFGEGSLLLGDGLLEIQPVGRRGSGPSRVTVADGTGCGLIFSGGATLAVEAGKSSRLDVTVGSSDGVTPAFQREGAGTLAIRGLSGFGRPVRVLSASPAQGPGAEPVSGLVFPALVIQDDQTPYSAAFATSSRAGGLKALAGREFFGRRLRGTHPQTVGRITRDMTVSGTVSLLACVIGREVSLDGGPDAALLLGQSGTAAGLILNGAICTVPMDAGAKELLVYANEAENQLAGRVTAGAVTKFGPGALFVSSGSAAATTVNSGTLVVNALADGDVWQSAVAVNRGGALTGSGTIAGSVTAYGTVSAADGPGTTLGITGDLTIEGTGFANFVPVRIGGEIVFTINASAAGGGTTPGVDWSLYTVGGTLTLPKNYSFRVAFDGVGEPVPGNTFWSQSRSFLVATAADIAINETTFSANTFYPLGSFRLRKSGTNLFLDFTRNNLP